MCINNRILSLSYKIILLTVCLIGIALISGWTKGAFSGEILNYYTIQSNLLVFVYFAILTGKILFDLKKEGFHGTTAIFPSFKGAVTLAITVTFLVYHFMLSASGFAMAGATTTFKIGNLLVHYITPLLVLADWILFDKKESFRIYDPFLWLLIPLAYFAFILIRAFFFGNIAGTNSRYPYFFIDIDKYGSAVALNVTFLAIGFLILGFIIVGIDRLLKNRTSKFVALK